MSRLDIIATLGPACNTRERIGELVSAGATFLRLNGAHGSLERIEEQLVELQAQRPGAHLLLDLPGNKVRLSNLDGPIEFTRNETFTIRGEQLNYAGFIGRMEPGAELSAADSKYTFTVERVVGTEMVLLPHFDGVLTENKGLHISGIHDGIPFLFEKDRRLIDLALRYRLDYIGLSFVRSAEDIREVKDLIGDRHIGLMAKVETRRAVENLSGILEEVDLILIDRGDLSTDVGLLNVTLWENSIVRQVREANRGTKLLLATQVLGNMVENPVPSIAEVSAVFNALLGGIDGFQLSEETAVGKYGAACIGVINSIEAIVHEHRVREHRVREHRMPGPA